MTIPQLQLELVKHFGRPAGKYVDSLLWRLTGLVRIDIVRLDDYLQRINPDYGEESMSDFIVRKYGREANDFVRDNI